MAITTSLVSNTIQPLYNKKLLEKAVQLLALAQYAQQEELPANIGATSIRFFRPPQADLTQVGAPAALTEGVAPTNYRDIAYTPIDVALAQIGQVAQVTDIATNVGLIKYLQTAIDLMGEEFALDVDTRLRNMLSHASTGLTKRYAQITANFAGLMAASLANGCVKPLDVLDSMTRLKLNRAPTFGGQYVWVVPPQVTRDILNNTEWQTMISHGHSEKYFKGEIGSVHNCRIVEFTNAFQEDEAEGTNVTSFVATGTNTTGLIYSSYVLGKGAFGTVDMKRLGARANANKPSIIINDKADKSDPLNQKTVVGWKAFYAGALLNANWGIALRTKSNFA
jgi:N4-gp56 family major capsid protein